MTELPQTNKTLGQHWLNDPESLEAMVASAGIGAEDTVLEIGPGPGALTERLVQAAKEVIAVEFDSTLARELTGRVTQAIGSPPSNLNVIQQDILHFNLTTLPPGYKVAANIPYYLTSKLLQLLCESPNPFAQAALLVQKEVAERVCAGPGQMGLLSVSAQLYCETSLGMLVPAELFTPPPKVDSQILVLKRRPSPLFPDLDTKQFFRVVKAGFAQRRKTLLNSLSSGLHLDRAAAEALLLQAHIEPSARAQTLSLKDWHALAQLTKTSA